MDASNKIDSLSDFSMRGIGELKAWMETWLLDREADFTWSDVGTGLGGATRLDLLIPQVGELTLWYRLGNVFSFPSPGDVAADVLLDSSNFPLPVGAVPHNLDYREHKGVAGWTAANRPSLDQPHTLLGPADDGCTTFNFKQTVWGGTVDPDSQPGAYFRGDTNGLASFEPMGPGNSALQPVGKEMHTLACLFKIATDAPPTGDIISNVEFVIGTGGGGWYLTQTTSPVADALAFVCSEPGQPTLILDTPGGLTRDTWYYVVVTRDISVSPARWTLWLNGEQVDQAQSATVDHGYFDFTRGLTIGGAGEGARDNYFKGSVDEVTCYASLLTPDQIMQLYAASTIGAEPGGDIGVYWEDVGI